MRLSINNFKARARYLEEIICKTESSLSTAPDGHLRITGYDGKKKYYLESGEADKRSSYIRRKDIIVAAQLAQKDYDQRILQAARAELVNLKKMIARYEIGIVEDIYGKLSPGRQELVTPIMMPDDEFISRWLSQEYTGPGFEEGYPYFYTDEGLRVRSKSEVSIANKYSKLGVPFLYEKPVFLKGRGWVYSDFSVLNVRLRKEFIHEHLGMMDEPEYARRAVVKIEAYERNGYFQGKNLILTFETKNEPFDTRRMDDIIDQYLR